jgi:ketosteroid isomerase-like protein
MDPQQNIKLVQQCYQNFKSGNIPALLDLLDDSVEWQLPDLKGVAVSGKRRGRKEVANFFTTLAQTQETLSFEPREFVAQGDKVVGLGHYSFRVKATGQAFESDWAQVFTIKNGKIARFQEYADSAAAVFAYQTAIAA